MSEINTLYNSYTTPKPVGLYISNLHVIFRFKDLLQYMEAYLRPITQQLDSIFRPSSASTTSKNKNVDKEPPQEYVVLLCDPDLMQLPLEALNSLQSESIVSVSREISLQMLYHKIQVKYLGGIFMTV